MLEYVFESKKYKFRAWDKSNKRMLKCIIGNSDETDDNFVCPLVWDLEKCAWVHFDENCGSIMEYIGRQDKNKKDIYTGDIIIDSRNNIGVVDYDKEMMKYVVIRFDSLPRSIYYQDINSLCDDITDMEIIGNYFENPEIIENFIK